MIMEMQVDLLSFGDEKCCGCGTCALVCPVGAIEMVPRELGSLYPHIDAEKCIGCHRCELECIFSKGNNETINTAVGFAAKATNGELRKKSASGGAFAAMAHCILETGGVVFGCAMDPTEQELTPKHIGINTQQELGKLQGSKYIQSELSDSFVQAKEQLNSGKTVLFAGTPCQIASLKHYLRNCNTENLYTVDLICHGVPSSKLFQDYIGHLQKSKTISSFVFRDKTFGWGLNAAYSIQKKNGKESIKNLYSGTSSYYSFFLSSEIYRKSCYSCPYAGRNRVGDITVGDFWGIEKEYPELISGKSALFSIKEGISLILVNTDKGNKLLKKSGGGLIVAPISVEYAAKWNSQLQAPSKYSSVRNELIKQYDKYGYSGVEKLFRKQLGITYWVRLVKQTIRPWIKA